MSDVLAAVGPRLRRLRQQRDLTLTAVVVVLYVAGGTAELACRSCVRIRTPRFLVLFASWSAGSTWTPSPGTAGETRPGSTPLSGTSCPVPLAADRLAVAGFSDGAS